jgi:molybdopterin adenylyltransferase
MKVGRVTCSDRVSAGIYEDAGGPEIERVFTTIWSEPVKFVSRIVADEVPAIEEALLQLADVEACALIITTGGTGISSRDVTPEATRAVLRKELPGFGEIMRTKTFRLAPTSILSRATAGVRGRSLIINLPGNPKAIGQCLPPLVPAIREALHHLQE